MLVTLGVGADPFGPPFGGDRLHTELQMETYFNGVSYVMAGCALSRNGKCSGATGWRQLGPFHKFIVFERTNYANLTAIYPCPAHEPACQAAPRPPRAVWMYLSFPEEKANVLVPAKQAGSPPHPSSPRLASPRLISPHLASHLASARQDALL